MPTARNYDAYRMLELHNNTSENAQRNKVMKVALFLLSELTTQGVPTEARDISLTPAWPVQNLRSFTKKQNSRQSFLPPILRMLDSPKIFPLLKLNQYSLTDFEFGAEFSYYTFSFERTSNGQKSLNVDFLEP